MHELDKINIQDMMREIQSVQMRKYELEQREKELFEELSEYLNNIPITSDEKEIINDTYLN